MSRHLVLCHTSLAVDPDKPLSNVIVVGTAETDREAINMMTDHFVANAFAMYGDDVELVPPNGIWLLRGGGPKGEDITGGCGSVTLYRAVPVRD